MTGIITLAEGATPATPSAGNITVFANTSNQLSYVQPSGSVVVPSTANLQGQTLITTAAGTTTLTNSSTYEQIFQGSTTQTLVLPVTSTLNAGFSFWLKNESTGAVSVQSSGLNAIVTLNSGDCALVTCILISGTTAASWDLQINAQRNGDVNQTFLVAPATLAAHAVQAGQVNAIGWATDSGSLNTVTLTPAIPILAYAVGQKFQFIKHTSNNNGATTVAVSSLGSLAAQINGNALVGGELVAGKMYTGILDTTSTIQVAPFTETYIEGTFTPTFVLTTPGTSSFGTYASQAGFFTKIGRLVTFDLYLAAGTFSLGTGSGSLLIAGLPFVIANQYPSFPIGNTSNFSVLWPTNALGGLTGNLIYLYSDSKATNIQSTSCASSISIRMSGTYTAAY